MQVSNEGLLTGNKDCPPLFISRNGAFVVNKKEGKHTDLHAFFLLPCAARKFGSKNK